MTSNPHVESLQLFSALFKLNKVIPMHKEQNYSDSNYGYKQSLTFMLNRKILIYSMSKRGQRGQKGPREANRLS